MASTKLTTDMLAAGFSWDEVKGDASTEYRDMLAAGFTQEETDKEIQDRWGMRFSYDPNSEDDLVLQEDIVSQPAPEDAHKQLVESEVNALYSQEVAAKAKENADKSIKQQYPFDSTYTPEQLAKIEEERKNLPIFRNYSDTELAHPTLYGLRDSAVVKTSARGDLTWRDRNYQDDLVKQGIIPQPEIQQPREEIRASTPQEIESAKTTPLMRQAESIGDYLSHGFRHSTTGLFFAEPPKDTFLPDKVPFAMQAASSMAQGLGDLPTTVAGGLMGAAATVETGPGMIAGAFAGAMGLNEGVRASLLLGYQRGSIDSVDEFMHRTGQVALATGKGAAMGYATGLTGGLAQASSPFIAAGLRGAAGTVLRASAQPVVEVATMTGLHAATEGRVPTMEDFALNGVMVGGMRLGGFYTSKLAYSFQKTGVAPETLIQYAKQNPAVKEDLLSGNMALPKEAGGNHQPLYLLRRNKPLDEPSIVPGDEVYHGSQRSDLTTFKLDEGVGYFTSSPDIAASYAIGIEGGAANKQGGVYKAKVAFKNPLVVDAKSADFSSIPFEGKKFSTVPYQDMAMERGRHSLPALARERGHDGVIIKNVLDNGPKTSAAKEKPSTVYIALDEKQIVSFGKHGEKQVESSKPTSNNWYHLSQNTATEVAGNLNKKNNVADAKAPEAYSVEAAAIPAETNLLWIKSRSDPNRVRLYKQFMKEVDPEATFGEHANVAKAATTMFENPVPKFVEFLQSGRGKIGPKEDVPLAAVSGLRIGDKVMIFNPKDILSGSVLETVSKPMEIAAADIQKSVSVNETTSVPHKQRALDTYQVLVDRLQPLNSTAAAGRTTVSYLAARLFMGVDGVANHWLSIGRTGFSRPSILREAGFERPVTGKSLKDVFEMGTARVKFSLDAEVSSAMEKTGVRIKEASVESNKSMLSALESMRQELAPAMYEKAKAQILESTDALANRQDPLNMFRTYVIAKHANELLAAGIEVGIDKTSIQTIARNPALRERFEPAAKELYAYQRALLDYRYRAGLLPKKTYDDMVLQYPEYIPLQRVMDDAGASASTGTFGVKGSTRDIIDPFESIIRQTQFTIREAERNSVLQLIAKEFGKPVTKESKTSMVGTLESFKDIEAEGRGANSQRTISYRVAGKEKKVGVPADIWRVASELDPVSANAFNGLVKAASSVAGVLRAGSIMHPNFGARNFFRDQFSAYINSDSNYRMFYDFGRGLTAVVSPKTGKSLFPKAQEYYSDWLRHGGSNANLVSQDRMFTQDMISTLLKTNNVQNSVPFELKAIDGVKHYINPLNWGRTGYKALQTLSEASEEGTRLGEFMRARESGANPMEAAYRSREVTMDFARIGAKMKALNAMNVFLNARIQGADRSIRQLRAHPERTMNRIMAGIVLPSTLLAFVQQDIIHHSPNSPMAQALQEVPDWQKNTFWLVPSDVGLFRIPIPHEYGVPFANPARSFIEHMYKQDPDKNFLQKLYDEDYFGTVGEQYFLDWNTIVGSMMPSAISPISEVTSNYSRFTGTPIIPPVMESQLPESRYNRNTTELSKSLSRQLSKINPLLDSNITQRLISPPAIDYLVAGYGGSLGRDLWSFLDTVAQKSGVIDKVNKPAKSIEDLPLVGAFMVKYPNAGSRSLNDFFDRAEKFEQALASVKSLMKEGSEPATRQAMQILNNADYGKFTAIRGAIADVSRGIRTVHFAADIPPEDKRKMIDSMYLDMIEMAKGGLATIKDIEKANKASRELAKEQ